MLKQSSFFPRADAEILMFSPGSLICLFFFFNSQEYAELLHEFMCAVKQNYGEKVLIQVQQNMKNNSND